MRCSAAVAQLLLLCLVLFPVTPAQAEIILYDDRETFMEALFSQQAYLDNFENLANGYYADPIVRSPDTEFEYSLASSSIVGLMAEDLLVSTILPKSIIQLAANAVQAIGGEFGLTDFEGTPIGGDLRITLQDGSVITRSISDSTVFIGVIGVGEDVTSLMVGAAANAPLVTVASIVVAVPGPGALPVMLLTTLLIGRSRKLRRH
ncbi:MAG: hypothetical protein VX527_09605 [Planctomycetota bacterium]|nr:hypothetical protein [Planctomycetota bacterium]